MKHITKRWIWDHWIAILFVITSGSIIYTYELGHAKAYIIYLFFSVINLFMVNKRKLQQNKSFSFIVFVMCLCFFSYVINESQYQDNSTFGYLTCLIATFFIISKYDFYYFRHLITNVVFVICLFGIPIFLFVENGILGYNIVQIGISNTNTREYAMYGVYTLGWPWLFHRFSGIWHEPGACQIILNTIIWLHFDNIIHWKLSKYQKYKLAVILVASLLTLSTGGYICLMFLIIAICLNMKSKKVNAIIYLLILILFIIAVVLLYNSDVIQNKLFDKQNDSVSKIARMSDAFALWKMTLEKPLIGYGLGTVDFWRKSDLYNNVHCSSGILTYTASLGITWLLLYFIYLKRGILRVYDKRYLWFLLIAIFIMQFNEKFIEYPISNILIFQFFSSTKNSKYYYG